MGTHELLYQIIKGYFCWRPKRPLLTFSVAEMSMAKISEHQIPKSQLITQFRDLQFAKGGGVNLFVSRFMSVNTSFNLISILYQ